MSIQAWIGTFFALALMVFLMITYFSKDRDSENQTNTLRFLIAFCAGCAGGFFSGEALFSLENDFVDGANLSIAGTAGFALFLTVWFTYPIRKSTPPPLAEYLKIDIPAGWTFSQAAQTIGKLSRKTVDLGELREDLQSRLLPEVHIEAQNGAEALEQLRRWSTSFPQYRVEDNSGVYYIRLLGSEAYGR